jgi:hypothetical protein
MAILISNITGPENPLPLRTLVRILHYCPAVPSLSVWPVLFKNSKYCVDIQME